MNTALRLVSLFIVLIIQILWIVPGLIFGCLDMLAWYLDTDEMEIVIVMDKVLDPLNWWLWTFKGYTIA